MNQRDYHIQGPQIHQFNNIQTRPIPRSSFKRDFTRRSTFDSDNLVPLMLDEILPGDDISIKMNALTRVATPIKPIMDNLYLDTFWFFVPNRLVWENWEKFQGEQANPTDSTTYSIPVLNKLQAPMSTTGFTEQSIFDYFGLPTKVTNLDRISCLFNRAYNLIWNEWFRDENIQNSVAVNTDDGPDNPGSYTLLKRGNRKDYFQSALPWPQKGTAVSISLGATAPVVFPTNPVPNSTAFIAVTDPGGVNLGQIQALAGAGAGHILTTTVPAANGPIKLLGDAPMPSDAYANLAAATPITINALRQAALYQQILELDARGGTRYVESIYTRFGVVSPDFRLQRPELIGQGSSRINIYAVPQTAPSDPTGTPQGNLAAFGASAINSGHGCTYSATEHGMLIALLNVRADLTYSQGIPKMFTRSTRLEFYEPYLNGLGEQAITNDEIYAQGTSADREPFGYAERFSEYRFKNSEITGLFRSNATASLDVWHLSNSFAGLPSLSSGFVNVYVPMDRVVAVPTEPKFLFDAFFEYNHVRPMPIRSNPGIDIL